MRISLIRRIFNFNKTKRTRFMCKNFFIIKHKKSSIMFRILRDDRNRTYCYMITKIKKKDTANTEFADGYMWSQSCSPYITSYEHIEFLIKEIKKEVKKYSRS